MRLFCRTWYFLGGRFHYKGPTSNLEQASIAKAMASEDEVKDTEAA